MLTPSSQITYSPRFKVHAPFPSGTGRVDGERGEFGVFSPPPDGADKWESDRWETNSRDLPKCSLTAHRRTHPEGSSHHPSLLPHGVRGYSPHTPAHVWRTLKAVFCRMHRGNVVAVIGCVGNQASILTRPPRALQYSTSWASYHYT
jgi:hypothetical protein